MIYNDYLTWFDVVLIIALARHCVHATYRLCLLLISVPHILTWHESSIKVQWNLSWETPVSRGWLLFRNWIFFYLSIWIYYLQWETICFQRPLLVEIGTVSQNRFRCDEIIIAHASRNTCQILYGLNNEKASEPSSAFDIYPLVQEKIPAFDVF